MPMMPDVSDVGVRAPRRIGYVLFDVPGAVIVERWSARKWTARIMISWGLASILSGLVHGRGQFYAARFFLGMAEASLFPGMIVYLTHWIRLSERGSPRCLSFWPWSGR